MFVTSSDLSHSITGSGSDDVPAGRGGAGEGVGRLTCHGLHQIYIRATVIYTFRQAFNMRLKWQAVKTQNGKELK